MLRRLYLLCVCLLVASTAGASTIVTWEANGSVVRRIDRLVAPEPGFPVAPPIGAPLSVTLTFDPASAVSAPFPMPDMLPGCQSVSVSGSVTIGSYSAAIAAGSKGYTQSNLPGGGPCQSGSQETQFELRLPAAPADNPFKLPAGILFLSYRDLLVQDAFPNSPTPSGLASLSYYDFVSEARWIFDGRATLTGVEQPAAVPEPGTMTLLGLGLAAAFRKRRAIFSERR